MPEIFFWHNSLRSLCQICHFWHPIMPSGSPEVQVQKAFRLQNRAGTSPDFWVRFEFESGVLDSFEFESDSKWIFGLEI